ncbi:MAG TPA: IPT/TIG domain-containing protein [Solirubrobacteraceae bacterium]
MRGTSSESRHARLRVRIGALAALAVAVSWAGAQSASAVLVEPTPGRRLSYQPLSGAPRFAATPFAGKKNLVYHGGPVMTSNTNYMFFWAPSGSQPYAAGYQTGVEKYLKDLAADSGGAQNVDSVATQYTGEPGQTANYDSHFGGVIIDTKPYPLNGCTAAPTCLTDEQIQAELTSYIEAHGLPQDLVHEYFLLTPPGVESCFGTASTECSAGSLSPAYCAYHGAISAPGGTIIYADDPYVLEVEGCDTGEHPNGASDSALLGGLSHEHNESVTDPTLNAWFGPEGQEDGDKCRTFEDLTEYGTQLGTAPDGSRYNQLVNGAEYWYQQEWSNQGSTCLQRLAATAPTVTKLTPKKGETSGGTSVTITGTGFAGATAVSFGGTPATSFEVNSPTSISAVSPEHSSGPIDVTVTTPGGTSAVSSADHFTYGKPTVTGVSPSSGTAAGGITVTVTGTGFALGSGTTLIFGKVHATGVNCTSSTSCTATTPPRAKPGNVEVFALVGKKSRKNPPLDTYEYT